MYTVSSPLGFGFWECGFLLDMLLTQQVQSQARQRIGERGHAMAPPSDNGARQGQPVAAARGVWPVFRLDGARAVPVRVTGPAWLRLNATILSFTIFPALLVHYSVGRLAVLGYWCASQGSEEIRINCRAANKLLKTNRLHGARADIFSVN